MRDARPAGVAALGIAVSLALGWVSLATYAPPPAAGPDAAPQEFSAVRARAAVEAIAGRPRPMGTPAHRAARDHLVKRLEELGLETELENATVLRARDGSLLGARVVNVLGRLPGNGKKGAILLMAHYDSMPNSPGASDDASGVATIVETLRALASGPPLERDVLVLLSDGEEAGLLGARAYVRDLSRLGGIALVLNFEARGGAGVVSMFESSAGNHLLVEEMRKAVPRPVASSLSYEVYRRMPNDTDFSVLRRAGVPGLNFAMIGRYASYHTSLDTAERLESASLQHQGSYAVALARHFGGGADVPPAGAEGVYFNLVGRFGFVAYSSNTARLLATLLAIVAAAGLTVRSRRHRGRVAGAGWGALLFLGAVIAAAVAALAVWRALLVAAPSLRQAPHGVPWIADWLAAAGALLTLALVAALVRSLSGLAEAADLWSGILVAWTLLAVVTSFFLPGASYLFLWPAFAGWLALWLAERLAGSRRRRVVVATAAALPAVVLLAPIGGQLLEALTVRQAGPALALLAWVAALLVVPLAEVTAWGRSWIEIGLAVAALVVLGVGLSTAAAGPATPSTGELFYVEDADVGRASWMSSDGAPSKWVGGFVDVETPRASVDLMVPGLRRPALSGAAPSLGLEPPELVVGPVEVPLRLRLRLRSRRGAPVLGAQLASETPFRVLSVDGERPPPELPATAEGGARELRLTFFAAPAEGIEIELEPGADRTFDAADFRLDARLADQTYGLPAIDGRAPRRPSGLIPPAGWTSDSTFVSTRIVWPGRPAGGPGDG